MYSVKMSFTMKVTDQEEVLEAMKYIMNNWSQTVNVERID